MRMKRFSYAAFGIILGTLGWSNFTLLPKSTDIKPIVTPTKTDPVKFTLIPQDYTLLALRDLNTIAPNDRVFIRYLAIRNINDLKTSSLTLNIISRSSNIIRPIPVQDNSLVRVDLRFYAPKADDLTEWLNFWEEFAFDPTFNLLITKDTFNLIDKSKLPKRKIKIPGPEREETRDITHPGGPYTYPDDSGRVVEYAKAGEYRVKLRFKGPEIEKEVDSFEGKDVIHIDPSDINLTILKQLTNSQAPIVEHKYFKTRVLSTVKDSGTFKDVWGGLYYEFRGVKTSKDPKVTDLDLFYESVGVGNTKAGLTADQQFEVLRSDQRVAIYHSKVTGKPRIVEMHHVLSDKEGNSWGAITDDIKDADVDIKNRGFANLLKPKIKAREGLFPGSNGFQIATLWNGDGKRQDEVPPDVANDHTIPSPYTKRLQGPISCLRCHNADGNDGYKPLDNDIRTLTSKNRFDIFGDLTKNNQIDAIDRLVGLYNGDFSKNLRRARNDQAEIFLKATGPWPESADQTDAAKIGAKHLCDDYAEYNYNLVDAHTALLELGYNITDIKKSQDILQRLLPPDLNNILEGIIPEDPTLAAIMSGISVNRTDWALVYTFALERAKRTPREKVKQWLEN